MEIDAGRRPLGFRNATFLNLGDWNVALLNFGSLADGPLVAPRIVRGHPSPVNGAYGVAARSLRDR